MAEKLPFFVKDFILSYWEKCIFADDGDESGVNIIWPKLDHPCDGAPLRLKTNKLLQMLKFCQMGSCHGQGLLMLMLVNGDGDGDGDGDVKMVNDPGVPNARWREAAMVKVQSRATETKQSFTSGATASWRSFGDKDKEITKTKTTTKVFHNLCCNQSLRVRNSIFKPVCKTG